MKKPNWRRILTIHIISEPLQERVSTEEADQVLERFVNIIETSLPNDEEIEQYCEEVRRIRPVLH